MTLVGGHQAETKAHHRLWGFVWIGLLAVCVALIVLAVVAGVVGYRLYQDLTQARSELNAAVSETESASVLMTDQQADDIEQHLTAADAALSRADAALGGDMVLSLLRTLPPVRTQLSAIGGLDAAARSLTQRHADIGQLLHALIAARDAPDGASRISALAHVAANSRTQILSLADSLAQAETLVAAVPSEGLLPQIQAARSEFQAQLTQFDPLISDVRVAVDVLPQLTGVGGHERYLVLALDDAELRPIGGFIGAFATPSFTDGTLSDITFRDISDVDLPVPTVFVKPPPALEDHLYGGLSWDIANSGWWPDFKDSAAEARRIYGIVTGDTDFQGTIAFTPEFVDDLLKIVGPVDIPAAGLTVHAGETYLVSLEQVEVLNSGQGRKAFLAELGSAVINRLLALPPERYPEVLAALDDAAQHRQLQVFLDNPSSEQVAESAGWYQPFTFPAGDRLAVIDANVTPPSKLDLLTDMAHSLDVTLNPDGSAQEILATKTTNAYSPDLPAALRPVSSVLGATGGMLGSYQRRYLDPNAEVDSVSNDDPDPDFAITDPEELQPESGCLVVGNYQLIPPGSRTLTTTYSVPDIVQDTAGDPSRQGTYELTFQKEAGRDHDSLTVVVHVPPHTHVTGMSEGGTSDGQTVTFQMTTEFDRHIQVTYASE